VLSESLYAVIVAAMLLIVYRFWRRPSWPDALVVGLTVGLAALCRGEGILFLPMLVVPAIAGVRRARARRPLLLLAATGAALLVIAPWMIYNVRRMR
jgi:Gpi18-like mannosyltransferase